MGVAHRPNPDLELHLGSTVVAAGRGEQHWAPDLAFLIGKDLSGGQVGAAAVLAATSAVAVAVDTGSGFVLGTPVPLVGIDLRLVGVVLEHNGGVAATASGAAASGHPAAAVAGFVRSLADDGGGLRAGDLVLCGGFAITALVAAGDCLVATIDRIGSVELACR